MYRTMGGSSEDILGQLFFQVQGAYKKRGKWDSRCPAWLRRPSLSYYCTAPATVRDLRGPPLFAQAP